MESVAVLPLLYLAPVQYYTKFFLYKEIYMQQAENYQKQSFRNRSNIYSANGKLSLSITIEKGRTPQIPYQSIKISYDEDWAKVHIRAIVSAYRASPFFEFYWDDYLPLFERKWDYLWDFNLGLHQLVLRDLGLSPKVKLVDNFAVPNMHNYLFLATAKGKTIPDALFTPKAYYQVFSDKSGFIPNLSILDLIFNEGPNAYAVLKESVK